MPWAGCTFPGLADIVDLGEVDLDRLDALDLLSLAQRIGIVPMRADNKPLTAEVLKKTIQEFALSA